MMRALIGVLMLGTVMGLPPNSAPPLSLDDRVALIGDRAFVLGEAQAIQTPPGQVVDYKWSMSSERGAFLHLPSQLSREAIQNTLRGQKAPSMRATIGVWSRRTNSLANVHTVDIASSFIESYGFIGASDWLSISTDSRQRDLGELVLVRPDQRKTVFSYQPSKQELDFGHDPDSLFALLRFSEGSYVTERFVHQIRVIDLQGGEVSPPLTLQGLENAYLGPAIWIPRLSSFAYLVTRVGVAERPTTGMATVVLVDPKTMGYQVQQMNLAEVVLQEPENELRRLPHAVALVEHQGPDGRKQQVALLTDTETAEGERPSSLPNPARPKTVPVVIASRVTHATLSPDGSAVVSLVDGIPLVHEIHQFSRKEFEDANLGRERIVSQARQVGTAILMYSSDWDDVLPIPGGDLREMILPYHLSESVLEGFVYTYSGPTSKDQIADLSKTEIGFIRGPGGVAVLFGDGRVEWRPDPPR